MKEITETVTENVPRTYIKKSYVCEVPGCNFVSDYYHGGAAHLAEHIEKGKWKRIGETVFVYFETEKDADAWGAGQDSDYHCVNFVGPGWYGVKHTSKYSHGGEDYGIEINTYKEFEEALEQERKEVIDNIIALKDLVSTKP